MSGKLGGAPSHPARRTASPLPDEQQQQLLRAALLSGHEGLTAWRSWKTQGGNTERLDPASFSMLPLVYRNLVANGIEDSELLGLRGVYRDAWYSNQRLFHRGAEAVRVLEATGLETIVLKGAALSALYYNDDGARSMSDFDVLVRTRAATAALEALTHAGWTLAQGPAEQALASHHSTALVAPDGAVLDLHWRALYLPARDDDFWGRAVPMTVGGAPTMTLGHTDHLLHACVHGLAKSGAPSFRWVADAMTVARVAGERLDWDRLLERAVARRVTASLHTALRHLRDAFALPVPERVLAGLRATPVTAAERRGFRAAFRPYSALASFVSAWDCYQRLRRGDHDSPIPDGYLRFLADGRRLTRRRQLGPHFARKVAETLLSTRPATPDSAERPGKHRRHAPPAHG